MMAEGCNAYTYDADTNSCSSAKVELPGLVYIAKEEVISVFMEPELYNQMNNLPTSTSNATTATNTTDATETTGIFFIGDGTSSDQIYGCKAKLPVTVGLFSRGGVTVLNGNTYIYNSADNKCYSGSLETSEAWAETTDCLSLNRLRPTMTALGNFILVLGGRLNNLVYYEEIERYDEKNGWTTLTNKLTSGRYLQCSVAISKTEMIVLGGFNGAFMSTVENYDVDGQLVDTLPSMNQARSGCGCTFYNEELYAAGGSFTATTLSDVEVFNMKKKSWKTISKMNTARYFLSLHVYQDQLMAFGGNGDGTKTIEIYRNQTWENSQNSLEDDFDFGVSVEIKCPA
ncbi:kelch-like protein 20 [Eurytemora carolleeae]|uniref:kelch-like protein 20 n=1 Tax=Eurytemora carolleeae TaxID=1294199 RepID=UPI000C78B23B|nr:kelch-like protein 20 [Eurytemora carolleeae]|eukprot:XP_023335715.1 kelch-like protein 20 [Eurytemora affinis]